MDPLEQLMYMSMQAQMDPSRPYTSGQALAGGAAGFGGQLQGALGQMGAMQAHNANTVSGYNQQQNALNAQLQSLGMQEQGRNNRLAMIMGSGAFGGGGSQMPGNITSNIGSGVSWGNQGGGGSSGGPQAYQYGTPPPGSPQSYQPQQQQSGGYQQSSGYQPMSQGPQAQQPAAIDRSGTDALRASRMAAKARVPQSYQPQAPGQGVTQYPNSGPYGSTDRFNRYRDEPPVVGNNMNHLQKQSLADWKAGRNGFNAGGLNQYGFQG